MVDNIKRHESGPKIKSRGDLLPAGLNQPLPHLLLQLSSPLARLQQQQLLLLQNTHKLRLLFLQLLADQLLQRPLLLLQLIYSSLPKGSFFFKSIQVLIRDFPLLHLQRNPDQPFDNDAALTLLFFGL